MTYGWFRVKAYNHNVACKLETSYPANKEEYRSISKWCRNNLEPKSWIISEFQVSFKYEKDAALFILHFPWDRVMNSYEWVRIWSKKNSYRLQSPRAVSEQEFKMMSQWCKDNLPPNSWFNYWEYFLYEITFSDEKYAVLFILNFPWEFVWWVETTTGLLDDHWPNRCHTPLVLLGNLTKKSFELWLTSWDHISVKTNGMRLNIPITFIITASLSNIKQMLHYFYCIFRKYYGR